MILEMGMDWMRLPWVMTVKILIGRMHSNASQADDRENKDINGAGGTSAARDRLEEWLSETPKTAAQIQMEEDDELLATFGVSRPQEEVNDD